MGPGFIHLLVVPHSATSLQFFKIEFEGSIFSMKSFIGWTYGVPGRRRGGEGEEEEEEEDHLELPSPNVGICCNIPGGIFCHQLNSCCRIPAHVDEETGVVHISHPSSSPL